MNKRGASLEQMYPAVMAIILIGIILGVGLYVLDETSEAISSTVITVRNETVSNVDELGVDVATADNCGFSAFTVLIVHNESDGDVIPVTNYTTDADAGSILNTVGDYNDSEWNVSYTYEGATSLATTGPCGSIETSITGIGGMASWVAVIITVIAAAIVLGVVMSSFGKRSGV